MKVFVTTKRENSVFFFHQQRLLPFLCILLICRPKLVKYIVYDVHDLIDEDARSISLAMRNKVLAWLESFVVKRGVRLITVSQGLADLLELRYFKRSIVIYNACKIGDIERNIVESSFPRSMKLCYFGIVDEFRIPVNLYSRLVDFFQCEKIDIFGYVSRISSFRPDSYECISYKGVFSPDDLGFLQGYDALVFVNESELNDNYRYCLPNKLFQCASAGLGLVTTTFFVELVRDLPFKNLGLNNSVGDSLVYIESKDVYNLACMLYGKSKKEFQQLCAREVPYA